VPLQPLGGCVALGARHVQRGPRHLDCGLARLDLGIGQEAVFAQTQGLVAKPHRLVERCPRLCHGRFGLGQLQFGQPVVQSHDDVTGRNCVAGIDIDRLDQSRQTRRKLRRAPGRERTGQLHPLDRRADFGLGDRNRGRFLGERGNDGENETAKQADSRRPE